MIEQQQHIKILAHKAFMAHYQDCLAMFMGVHSLNLEQSCDYIWQLLLRLQGHFSYFMPVGPPGFDLIAALHLVLLQHSSDCGRCVIRRAKTNGWRIVVYTLNKPQMAIAISHDMTLVCVCSEKKLKTCWLQLQKINCYQNVSEQLNFDIFV